MVGIRFDKMKAMFFDRKAVVGAVDRATRKVLSKFGAFVRKTARHSIRKRKSVSKPGNPPSSHVGLLKRLIFFGFDTTRKSVVIGPTPLRGTPVAPPLLEYGGRTRRKDRKGKGVTAKYKARPYMGPAFQKEKSKLPALWAGSVRKQ
ncbi:MAG: hypothetical protein BWX88_05189 [Planctomycetes bacterium ADurb.Bin126]|nr:MAG: hypothetical protein BWX88_05189 [Planctomycetes bacterium ADurb.Bin126]